MNILANPPHPLDKKRSVPRPVAFWLVGAAIATVTAASSAPSPLYPVYQMRFRFSEITLTVIFSIYVFSLLISLLTVGRLSDYIGRRVVLACALAVDAGAMALFVGSNSVEWLLWARAVQGFATGAAFGVTGAYLFDLQPAGSRSGSLVNTALPLLGIGLGAVMAGVLVEYGPHPTRLIFVILLALFVLLALATALVPETVRRVPGAAATLRPRVAVPERARRAFAGAVPTMVSSWALNGLTLSVGASLLGTVFRQSNHGVIGIVIGLFTLSAAAASIVERDVAVNHGSARQRCHRGGGSTIRSGTCFDLNRSVCCLFDRRRGRLRDGLPWVDSLGEPTGRASREGRVDLSCIPGELPCLQYPGTGGRRTSHPYRLTPDVVGLCLPNCPHRVQRLDVRTIEHSSAARHCMTHPESRLLTINRVNCTSVGFSCPRSVRNDRHANGQIGLPSR